MKRLVRYLSGNADAVVWLPKPEVDADAGVPLVCWTDSDWAADRLTRRNQSSFHIEAGGVPLHGGSRRHPTVAIPSGQSEFYAAAGGVSE